ncbi:unnamed protein product [Soboliphyme baturini]|uniref:Uncharacterized protein n=1 Tax=Soboliphyme baturini TaxID=241478 RepID=A0A183IBA9_9BILA|nr:unnamed protein product [Soboliphyme baturini]
MSNRQRARGKLDADLHVVCSFITLPATTDQVVILSRRLVLVTRQLWIAGRSFDGVAVEDEIRGSTGRRQMAIFPATRRREASQQPVSVRGESDTGSGSGSSQALSFHWKATENAMTLKYNNGGSEMAHSCPTLGLTQLSLVRQLDGFGLSGSLVRFKSFGGMTKVLRYVHCVFTLLDASVRQSMNDGAAHCFRGRTCKS